jgi:hypothetical protein
VEVETGWHSVWLSGGGVVAEPIFVPRPGNGNGTAHAEDDGWVLALAYDPASDTSNVTVLDARGLSAGPLARAWFGRQGCQMQLVIDPQFTGLDGLGDGGNARLGTLDERFEVRLGPFGNDRRRK